MAMSKAGVPDEAIDAMMREYEPAMMASMGLGMMTSSDRGADQLETFLVSEIAKDNYDKAVDYAHTRKTDAHKLTCLIRIIQTVISRSY
jgi:hypothetical protein